MRSTVGPALLVVLAAALGSADSMAAQEPKPKPSIGVPGRVDARPVAPAPTPPAPAPTPTSYAFDLNRIRVKTTWYKHFGDREAVLLVLEVSDSRAAPTDSGALVVLNPFIVKSGQDISFAPGQVRLWGRPIQGHLRIKGHLLITHPQKLHNLRLAVWKAVSAQPAYLALWKSGELGKQVVHYFWWAHSDVALAIANISTEVVRAAGTAVCTGGNPFTFRDKNENVFAPGDVQAVATEGETKLMSFIHGAKQKTCWREIWYRTYVRAGNP
jgi:hypothetical protein